MKREVEVTAWIGDQVFVPALECNSTIVSVHFTERGPTYQVAWFHNGDRHVEYLYPHEIRALSKQDNRA